jgi:hypothetical protein
MRFSGAARLCRALCSAETSTGILGDGGGCEELMHVDYVYGEAFITLRREGPGSMGVWPRGRPLAADMLY